MHKHVKKAANLHYRWWLGFFLLSALITVFALRANNQHMVQLRDQVYAADKNGQNVEEALDKLRSYVYGHMNTNLSTNNNIKPPIQLQYTYQRLESTALDRAQLTNEKIYNDAQNYCQATIPQGFYGTGRVPCVQKYVSEHAPQSLPKTVPASLYQFDFLSPSWSPDLAGFALLLTGVLFMCMTVSLIRHMFAGKRDAFIG